jgi:hypothetical protein
MTDTPRGLQPGEFSVHRPSQRWDSPKALPAPVHVSGGMVVPVELRPSVRAGAPADAQAFVDQDAAASSRCDHAHMPQRDK